MSKNFLIRSRHQSIFYFRRRIPQDIEKHFTKKVLTKSLHTSNKKIAIILARNLASHTDTLFEKLRDMTKTNNGNFLAGYTLKINLDKDRQPISIDLDAQPHETQAVQAVLSTLIGSDNLVRNTTTSAISNAPAQPLKDFQSWIDEYINKADLKPNTILNYRSKLQFAKEYFQERANVLDVKQSNIVEFSEHVKSQIGNASTQSYYIQVAIKFFNWHRSRNDLSLLTSSTLIPRRKTPEYDDREALTLDDMRVIFANAYTYSRKAPYKWWVTIAVAFMGCRIEEICQVNLVTDLIHDTENDIWYFKFDEKPDVDGIVRKSLKKLPSWRHLPIHSALVRHGFIDYLKLQMKQGRTRPFEGGWAPRIIPTDKIIKWSQYPAKWGGRELNKLANAGLIERGYKTYFHSMRHTIAKLMQESNVSIEISEAIAGREAGVGEQGRYGKINKNHELLSREGTEKALNPLKEILESVIKGN